MRLSDTKKYDIREEIMGIYSNPENKIEKRKRECAKDNYLAWIPQYQSTIDKLPIEMIAHNKEISLDVDGLDPIGTAHYKWGYSFDKPVPTQSSGTGYYASSMSTPVMPETVDIAVQIMQDDRDLQAEKQTLRSFVLECLDKVTTTKQLRELWVDYPVLAKSIPPEPVRKKKEAQLVLDLDNTLELGALNKRLTENLLDDY